MSNAFHSDDEAGRGVGHGPRPNIPRDGATRLLVSCRDADEAALALVGGADWIDLKEPSRGALGAVSLDVAIRAATAIPCGVPCSAAAGELLEWPRSTARELLTAPRVEYLKLGLAGCRDRPEWRELWGMARDEAFRCGKGLAAVAYADADAAASPSCVEIVEFAIAERAPILLIDTFSKVDVGTPSVASDDSASGLSRRVGRVRNLFDWMDVSALAVLFRAARNADVCTAAAGSLDQQSLSSIPWREVDIVAVRGAACSAGRNSAIDPCRVAEIQAVLRRISGVGGWAIPEEELCPAVHLSGSLSQKSD